MTKLVLQVLEKLSAVYSRCSGKELPVLHCRSVTRVVLTEAGDRQEGVSSLLLPSPAASLLSPLLMEPNTEQTTKQKCVFLPSSPSPTEQSTLDLELKDNSLTGAQTQNH